MSRKKTCRLPLTPAVNATDLPSGDMAGDSSRPGRSVSRMTRISGRDGSAAGLPNLSRSPQRKTKVVAIASDSAESARRDHHRGIGTEARSAGVAIVSSISIRASAMS